MSEGRFVHPSTRMRVSSSVVRPSHELYADTRVSAFREFRAPSGWRYAYLMNSALLPSARVNDVR
jgi:hypothetical protein